MGFSLPLSIGIAVIVAGLLAYVTALGVIRHGDRLLDHPGPRSSHDQPKPRGGGAGIVLVGLVAIAALGWIDAWPISWIYSLLAFAMVAIVGFADDVRAQPAALRLLAHLGASILLVAHSLPVFGPEPSWWIVAGAVLWVAWSVNLHNFMDGIDGLLTVQTIWFGLAYSVLYSLAGESGPMLFALLLGAAALGFLPLNFPRSRVFLGDGASGFIGLSMGWLAAYGALRGAIPWPLSIVIASAFLIDGTATLIGRLMRGERIWHAHRDHVYQRLTRTGCSHSRVTTGYLLWNLVVALPILLWMRLLDVQTQWIIATAVCVAGFIVWMSLRRGTMSAAIENT